MDTNNEEYFVRILQKYVPIYDLKPPAETVHATEMFDTFVAKMKVKKNRETFLRAAWRHVSQSDPRLYQSTVQNGVEWKIRKALETHGLNVDERFVQMCDEPVGFPGTKSSDAENSELKWTDKSPAEKTGKFKATKNFNTDTGLSVTDAKGMTDELWKSASGIPVDDLIAKGVDGVVGVAEYVGLWRYILGRDLQSSRVEGNEETNLPLFDIGLGELAYAIFQLLVKGIPDDVEVNMWFSIKQSTLREVWLKENNVAPTRFWCEAAILFVRVFLRMFLVLGVENTRTLFTIMGTPYDVNPNVRKKENILYSLPETLAGRSMNEAGKWIKGVKLKKADGT